MKNLGNLMKQAQQMQEKMAEMQARLADIEVSGSAGGGMIQVTLNGKGEFRRVRIDPALVRPEEIAVLEDLIVAASNDARMKVETMAQDEMRKLTGGLPIPPGMKLPF
jgi:DNA-binding YbaB/EbfC family protein